MRRQWFGDNRDYVKWSCIRAEATDALAVVYGPMLREDSHSGERLDPKVKQFFDKPKNFSVISELFPAGFSYLPHTYEVDNSDRYFDRFEELITDAQQESKVLVFLDPDTGIQPRKSKPGNAHLLESDMKRVCQQLRAGEKLVVYQHASREAGWREVRSKDLMALAATMGTCLGEPYHEEKTAKDVCFFVFTKAS